MLVGTAAAHALATRARPVASTADRRLGSVTLPVGLAAHVWWCALGALVVALAIQVGTNYANDYSDGIRGTDDVRVGPVRLVASGLASPAAVKRAALVCLRRGRRGRAGPGLGHLVVGPGGRRGLPGRRLVLHRGAPALRLCRARASCSCSCSSGWWPPSAPSTSRRCSLDVPVVWFAAVAGGPAGHRPAAGQQPAGHRDRHRQRASGPWPSGSAGGRRAGCYVACVVAAVRRGAGLGPAVGDRRGARGPSRPSPSCPCWPCRLAVAPVRLVSGATPTGGPCCRCWPPPAGCSWSSASCCRSPCGCGSAVDPVGPGSRRRGFRPRCRPRCERTSAATASGCCRWGAWPAPGTTAWVALAPMASTIRRPRAVNLLVVAAGDDQHRHGQAAELRPTAAAGCRCRPAAGSRPARAGVAQPLREPVGARDRCRRTSGCPATAGGTPRPVSGRPARSAAGRAVGQRLVGDAGGPGARRRPRCRRCPRSAPGASTSSGRARARWRQNRAPIE